MDDFKKFIEKICKEYNAKLKSFEILNEESIVCIVNNEANNISVKELTKIHKELIPYIEENNINEKYSVELASN